jgi:hypothetical protein
MSRDLHGWSHKLFVCFISYVCDLLLVELFAFVVSLIWFGDFTERGVRHTILVAYLSTLWLTFHVCGALYYVCPYMLLHHMLLHMHAS